MKISEKIAFTVEMLAAFIVLSAMLILLSSCQKDILLGTHKDVPTLQEVDYRFIPNVTVPVWNSGMNDLLNNKFAREGIVQTPPVTIYEEYDYAFYNFFKKDTIVCWRYIDTLQAHSVILSAKDGITVVYSRANTRLWVMPDPYISSNIGAQLDTFGVYMTTLNPKADKFRLNQMRNAGGGGISWILSLCQPLQYRTSVVTLHGNTTGWGTVLDYDWDDEVRWHEGGHGDGSQHTHAPVWNGNGGKIDDCGGYAGYSEGVTTGVSEPNLRGCTINVDSAKTVCWLPFSNVGGSGMSYCHLTEGTIKFANGMGFEPAMLMKYNIAVADNCLVYHNICQPLIQITGTITYTSTPAANGQGVDLILTANGVGGAPYTYIWTHSYSPSSIWYDKSISIGSYKMPAGKTTTFQAIIHSSNPCYKDAIIQIKI